MSADARPSYLADSQAMGVPGALPLAFEAVDLREAPDHPEHRFRLEVPVGAVLAVLGDEDSGVGDLGRYVLGLDRPRSGRVLVFGTDVCGLAYYPLLTFRRRVGYTQTGDGLLQNLTLRGNITLPLSYASDHRTREIEGRVEALVDMLGLRDVAHLRPAAANEEDRRRTAVARALALDPELLVMEAPFDGLTARAAKEILEQVRTRADGTPRTVFLTAQELLPAVTGLLTRVVLVVDGQAVGGAT